MLTIGTMLYSLSLELIRLANWNFLSNILTAHHYLSNPNASVFGTPFFNFLFLYTNFVIHTAAAAKSLQSCPTLCDPIDGSLPGSPVPGILQARILEWVAISFSNAWKWKLKAKLLSRVRLLATPWTAAHQAPPSMGFSRQEYWSGVPLPSPILHTQLIKFWYSLP